MAITINDIAKLAGVSPSTVSRVVNDSPLISEKTKLRVRTIMDEYHYIPNSIGKQLAKSSSYNIGFIIDRSDSTILLDQFFYNIIIGAHSIILAKNYDMTICNIEYLENSGDFLNRFVYSKKVDGLILINTSIVNETVINKLNKIQFPYVVIGNPGYDDVTWVDIDNISAGEIAAQHLIDKNYKNIAFIGGSKNEPISSKRLKGYKKLLSEASIAENSDLIKQGMGTNSDGYNLTKELLSLPFPPDALICINNLTALGALKAVEEQNLRVPEDIGIIAFDSYPLAPYITPSLTSIHIDTFELGKLAGDLLMKKIENPQSRNQISMIVPKLEVRESTERI